jgi:hypothetical protein
MALVAAINASIPEADSAVRFSKSSAMQSRRPPLIGERAATRGRIATEGGDEHPGLLLRQRLQTLVGITPVYHPQHPKPRFSKPR